MGRQVLDAAGASARARTLLARAGAPGGPGRVLLGVAGAPGAGKSTLCSQIVQELGPGAVLVPMDGFHLAQAQLERLGRAARKGAPDTFDVAGYVALLRRLREGATGDGAGTVYAPEFRRDLEEPVAGAVAVPAGTALVVTEGNYLLLEDDGWGAVAPLLDETWFVAPDEHLRRERLVARHVRHGRDPRSARAWALGTDEANAVRVRATAARADVVVDPG